MATARATTIANDSPFCESRQNMKKLEDDLTSEDAMNAPLHESERMLRTQGREMLRAMMQAHFDRRSEQERPVDVRGIDNRARPAGQDVSADLWPVPPKQIRDDRGTTLAMMTTRRPRPPRADCARRRVPCSRLGDRVRRPTTAQARMKSGPCDP